MGAAGQGVPEEESQVMFSRSLALQSEGADEWNIRWENTGASDSYRLIVRCPWAHGKAKSKSHPPMRQPGKDR
jgi:hypothetical protein